MGNGNIDAGNKTPTREPRQPIVESTAGTGGSSELRSGEPAQKKKPRICAAMTQQCGDGGRGNRSTPQKLLQLVGYRDPDARHQAWVRPRPPR